MLATSGGHVVDRAATVHRVGRWWSGLKVHRFTVRRRRGGCLAWRYVFSVAQQNLLRNVLLLDSLLLWWQRLASGDRLGRSLQHGRDDAFEAILKVDDFVRVLHLCAWFRLNTRHFCRSDDR